MVYLYCGFIRLFQQAFIGFFIADLSCGKVNNRKITQFLRFFLEFIKKLYENIKNPEKSIELFFLLCYNSVIIYHQVRYYYENKKRK